MIQQRAFALRLAFGLTALLAESTTAQVQVEMPKTKTAQSSGKPATVFDTLKSSKVVAGKLQSVVEGSSFIVEADGQDQWLPPTARTVDYPMEGVSLGQGWDSLRESKTSSACIVFSPEESGGQRARIETRRIFDTDSLRKAVELSTSVSAKAKFGVGGGGASGKYTFVSNSEVANQYLNLLVKGSITNGVSFVSPSKTSRGFVELTQQASAFFAGTKSAMEKRDIFVRHCGDSFVAAIERGAELYALYQFSDEKIAKQQTTTRSFSANASYMAFSGSASTSSKNTLETVQQRQVSGLKYMHSAHRGLRLPYNEETINAALASLGSAPEASDAQPYRIMLVRYDSLPGWTNGPLRSGPATRDALVAMQYRLTDLQSTVADMLRAPKNYDFTQAADLEAAGVLPQLIGKTLSRIETLLEDCEKTKVAAATEEQKVQVLDKCTPRADDAGLSDYPIRMLMPVARSRLVAVMTEGDVQTRQKEINDLRAQFNATRARLGPARVACPGFPTVEPCRGILSRITKLESELKLFKEKSQYLNVAESRYRYWIQEIADAREEEGALIGSLNASERAMFRREIYCQYGISPDSASCPELSLTKLVLAGGLIKRVNEASFDVKGEQKPKPEDAWEDAQKKMVAEISRLAGSFPHSYEALEQEVTASGNTQGPTSFRVRGTVRITSYASDAPALNRLFLSPR